MSASIPPPTRTGRPTAPTVPAPYVPHTLVAFVCSCICFSVCFYRCRRVHLCVSRSHSPHTCGRLWCQVAGDEIAGVNKGLNLVALRVLDCS